jgi:two-component system, chemotaxis family, CheB/CheR fusion protein
MARPPGHIEERRPMSIEKPQSRPSSVVDTPMIIAVAYFAGDIAAPSELVSALPADCDAAFIFVQQTAAGPERRLTDALAKRTTLPVMQAHDGLVAEHGHIYVIPPNVVPTLTHGAIRVTPAANRTDCPADILLVSLAQELGDKAIGVILSGGSTDVAPGIRAIRQAGGTTFVQYPGSARFPSLPIDAIDTGCVDFVLRPNEIAHELTRISRQAPTPMRNVVPALVIPAMTECKVPHFEDSPLEDSPPVGRRAP